MHRKFKLCVHKAGGCACMHARLSTAAQLRFGRSTSRMRRVHFCDVAGYLSSNLFGICDANIFLPYLGFSHLSQIIWIIGSLLIFVKQFHVCDASDNRD